MSILKEIYEYKVGFISNQKETTPQSVIENKLNINNINFPFFEKLNHQKSQISIIGEIKKASPSLGKFTKENINLIDFAKAYEDNNISCISVLTDEKYFNGKIERRWHGLQEFILMGWAPPPFSNRHQQNK